MTAKLKILFVDDELPILHGMRRMLRDKNEEWDMRFEMSAEAALVSIERDPPDVIVTDMRMPGTNGAELLKTIREQHPETIRLVLSGYSDEEATTQSALVAHQFITKPCEPQTLTAMITRLSQLQKLMKNEALLKLVAGIDRIPSLPDLYVAITRELQSSDPKLDEVIELIEQDPALSLKILQLVNSGFFGLPQRVSSVVEASRFLGVETIQSIVLFSGIYTQVESSSPLPLSYEEFSRHSLEVAHLATGLCELLQLPNQSRKEAFTAGILHDIGKLILALNCGELYGRLLRSVETSGASLIDLEQEIFGVTHDLIGSYLITLWGLPSSLAEAVAFHSKPSLCSHREPCTLTAIHLADIITKRRFSRANPPALEDFDLAYLQETNFAERIPQCIELHYETSLS